MFLSTGKVTIEPDEEIEPKEEYDDTKKHQGMNLIYKEYEGYCT